ncbi:MAG: phosphoribosylformylglycinamidine synthase subunit PurQ [Alphaproteobacteria bacterium]
MKAAVIVFPGSNCDRDMQVALEAATGKPVPMIWHGDTELPKGLDLIALPGGFSYGDYLRCGAMSARAKIMPAVIEAANKGVAVLGVCNGFQVLTEAGLLPGALMRNAALKFVCRDVDLKVEDNASPFTSGYKAGQTISIPVAHHDGNYVADDETLNRLEGDGLVAFRYVDNPNGSARDIAGIYSPNKRVLGMMPHPERMADPMLGGLDGKPMFDALVEAL